MPRCSPEAGPGRELHGLTRLVRGLAQLWDQGEKGRAETEAWRGRKTQTKPTPYPATPSSNCLPSFSDAEHQTLPETPLLRFIHIPSRSRGPYTPAYWHLQVCLECPFTQKTTTTFLVTMALCGPRAKSSIKRDRNDDGDRETKTRRGTTALTFL